MKNKTIKNIIYFIRGLWGCLSLTILFFSIYRLNILVDMYDFAELIGIMGFCMFILCFPCGFISVAFLFITSLVTETLFPTDSLIFNKYISFIYVWLSFGISGYFQWFYLLPKLLRVNNKKH